MQPGCLSFHIIRMCVTDRNNRMTTIQIKVFRTLIIPYMTTFSLDNVYVKRGYTSNNFINSSLLKSRRFQPQPYGFFQIEHEIHIMDRLSACPLQQVVNARDNQQFIAMLLQMNQTLVGVHHLLQIYILSTI